MATCMPEFKVNRNIICESFAGLWKIYSSNSRENAILGKRVCNRFIFSKWTIKLNPQRVVVGWWRKVAVLGEELELFRSLKNTTIIQKYKFFPKKFSNLQRMNVRYCIFLIWNRFPLGLTDIGISFGYNMRILRSARLGAHVHSKSFSCQRQFSS